jgi:hypothetical protein
MFFEVDFVFQFHLATFDFFFQFDPHSLDCYFFSWFILFSILSFIILFHLFFYIRFCLHSFNCYLFFYPFHDWFFSISSLDIWMNENFASWFFHVFFYGVILVSCPKSWVSKISLIWLCIFFVLLKKRWFVFNFIPWH